VTALRSSLPLVGRVGPEVRGGGMALLPHPTRPGYRRSTRPIEGREGRSVRHLWLEEKRMSVERARQLRKAMTPHEVRLWVRLRDLKPLGFRFRRQVPLGPYVVDFACYQSRLVIEIDGGQHGRQDHSRRDAERDTNLTGGGFKVLRFWNDEIWSNADGVVATILRESNGRFSGQDPTP
jgi:very-short-patch-repair endonuclease